MRKTTALLAFALLAAACGGATATTTTAQPDTTAASSTTTALSTTSSTVPPTTTTTAAPAIVIASSGPLTVAISEDCQGLGDANVEGTVVWADGERLWEATTTGAIRCLFETTGAIDSIQFGPQGDRALLNATLLVGGPSEGAELPDDTAWKFSYPTGRNLVGIDGAGSLIKYLGDSATSSPIDPLTRHHAVAYHPSGLHLAVSGDQVFHEELDPAMGIFITNTDGTEPATLAASFDAHIVEMAFSNDATSIYFIADHDGARHLHGNSVVPIELDDGTRRLGEGAEEVAATLGAFPAESDLTLSRVVVHPSNPSLVAWATNTCGPPGSLGFQVFDGNDLSESAADHESLLEVLGPATTMGFLGADPSVVTVATTSGMCGEMGQVALTTVSLDTGEVDSLQITGDATAVAVRSIAAPHQWDLVDVDIVGFA